MSGLKTNTIKRNLRVALLTGTALVGLGLPQAARALPQGGTVVSGVAQIVIKSPTEIEIHQSSQRVAIDWQSFSIGANEKVNFVQLSQMAEVLNRVLGPGASQILGQLSANGVVILSNPNGIHFGPGAKIDVGALIATTAGIKVPDFMAGQLKFDEASASAGASVTNAGTITAAEAGLVAFVAPGVENSGLIQARLGKVQLVSGNTFTLDLYGDKLVHVAVSDKVMSRVTGADGKTLATLVSNSGSIVADGGTVILTANAAREAVNHVINMDGVVRARTVASAGGEIVLGGGDGLVTVAGTVDATGDNAGEKGGAIRVSTGALINDGTLDASGQAGGGTVQVAAIDVIHQGAIRADGAAGKGGSVTVAASGDYLDVAAAVTSASGATDGGAVKVTGGMADGTVFSSGSLKATGGTGKGGTVDVTAHRVALIDSEIDASGDAGGGTVRAGGAWQGGAGLAAAAKTMVSPTTTLKADARVSGKGGTVVVWSDEETLYTGSASARGGAMGGDGGMIEVSSKNHLTFAGTGDAGAANGAAGQLLLDPKNITITDTAGAYPQFQLVDPNYDAADAFGQHVVTLDNGNVAVTDHADGANDVGAVYLYNGLTGALIGAVTGTNNNDHVGSEGVTALNNASGHFVIASSGWNGTRGAATWVNGTTGKALDGTSLVSAANSIIGANANDYVGSHGVVRLTNGHYVVRSQHWNNGAGAVTLGNGNGVSFFTVDNTTSLVGSAAGDMVGNSGVVALSNGNYVVLSSVWDNGGTSDAGAVTWGSGVNGVKGFVSAANSIVGTNANDRVGLNGVVELTNDHFVVVSSQWNATRGAVTWVNGTTGKDTTNNFGAVSNLNSLVGANGNDYVGNYGVVALTNDHYVVRSPYWRNGVNAYAGAVTWGNGTDGSTVGTVGTGNSLYGTLGNNRVGIGGVIALTNGHYVVLSPEWEENGVTLNIGAATWVDGTGPTAAAVTKLNSLHGTTDGDGVGSKGIALTNGHYVIGSHLWDNGGATDVGAATWGNGTGPTAAAVSAANSLVGSSTTDAVGLNLVPLTNGHYVVVSTLWDNGGATDVGAATWGDGTTGTTGTVGAANSLVGSSANDKIASGGVVALTNGHYVVVSSNWGGGKGAVTWRNGSASTTATVGAANSLVGSATTDDVGSSVVALADGNYLVLSPDWNGQAGAITWGHGTLGTVGAVSNANSMIGDAPSAQLTYKGVNTTHDTFNATMTGQRVLVGLTDTSTLPFNFGTSQNATLSAAGLARLLGTGTAVTLQASNDITLASALSVNNTNGNGGNLKLQAGRSILLNANVTTDNGNLTLIANEHLIQGVVDAQRDAGDAVITAAGGTTIDVGTGTLTVTMQDGSGKTNRTSGNISLANVTGNTLTVQYYNANNQTVSVTGALNVNILTTTGTAGFVNPYKLALLGGATVGTATFGHTGRLILGDGAGDVLTFTNGLTYSHDTELFGIVRTSGTAIALSQPFLNGNATLDTTNNGGFAASTISLNDGGASLNGHTLTLVPGGVQGGGGGGGSGSGSSGVGSAASPSTPEDIAVTQATVAATSASRAATATTGATTVASAGAGALGVAALNSPAQVLGGAGPLVAVPVDTFRKAFPLMLADGTWTGAYPQAAASVESVWTEEKKTAKK